MSPGPFRRAPEISRHAPLHIRENFPRSGPPTPNRESWEICPRIEQFSWIVLVTKRGRSDPSPLENRPINDTRSAREEWRNPSPARKRPFRELVRRRKTQNLRLNALES